MNRNIYAAPCFLCAENVPSGEGELDGKSIRGQWRVRHIVCPMLSASETNVAHSIEQTARRWGTTLSKTLSDYFTHHQTYEDTTR